MDITGGSALYTAGSLSLRPTSERLPCSFVTYTLSVYDTNAAGELPIATSTEPVPVSDTTIGFLATADDDGVVCLRDDDQHRQARFDRAPMRVE